MSTVDIIIEERAAQIGNFLVGRLLPFRQKRSVGPFIFIDHMGPAEFTADEQFDVDPHPHIGLSTLTYLLEGNVMHRDSLGSEIEITPGAVNWMTAGKGVVHSERTPETLRNQPKKLHGLQIWIALPRDKEQIEPSFVHIEAQELPSWEEGGVAFKLIAGEAFGHKAPVPVYSPLFLLELTALDEAVSVQVSPELKGEKAVYILNGSMVLDGETYGAKQLLVNTSEEWCTFIMEEGTRVYLLGGEAFPEERFIDWNFVSSSRATIDEAIASWKAHAFPPMTNDTGYVPYPDRPKK